MVVGGGVGIFCLDEGANEAEEELEVWLLLLMVGRLSGKSVVFTSRHHNRVFKENSTRHMFRTNFRIP